MDNRTRSAQEVPAALPVPSEVVYSCGACGQANGIKVPPVVIAIEIVDRLNIFFVIKPTDPIRCRQCGYRILYKIRTKRCKYYY